jgi:hypothetical protein
MTSKTSSPIAVRNRTNALLSTGPGTDTGKARARTNSIKHGLCANPATGRGRRPFGLRLALRRRTHPNEDRSD